MRVESLEYQIKCCQDKIKLLKKNTRSKLDLFYLYCLPSASCIFRLRRRKFPFCQVVHPSAHYTTPVPFCQSHFRLLSVCHPPPFYLFFLKKERSSNIFIKFSFFFYAFSHFFNIILLLFYTFSYFFSFLREFFRFYEIIHDVKKYVQYVYMYLCIYVYTYLRKCFSMKTFS